MEKEARRDQLSTAIDLFFSLSQFHFNLQFPWDTAHSLGLCPSIIEPSDLALQSIYPKFILDPISRAVATCPRRMAGPRMRCAFSVAPISAPFQSRNTSFRISVSPAGCTHFPISLKRRRATEQPRTSASRWNMSAETQVDTK